MKMCNALQGSGEVAAAALEGLVEATAEDQLGVIAARWAKGARASRVTADLWLCLEPTVLPPVRGAQGATTYS